MYRLPVFLGLFRLKILLPATPTSAILSQGSSLETFPRTLRRTPPASTVMNAPKTRDTDRNSAATARNSKLAPHRPSPARHRAMAAEKRAVARLTASLRGCTINRFVIGFLPVYSM